jgi:hypothetical protein
MYNSIRWGFIIAVTLASCPADPVVAQRPQPDTTTVKGHTMYTLMKPGGIPAIFEPEFIPLSQADSFYHPEEPLIVVVHEGTARGYSTWHLDAHEVVNDQIGNTSFAVTW